MLKIKNKKLFFSIVIAIFLFLIVFLFFLSFPNEEISKINGIILFEGENCSHCDTVDNFIKDNKIEDKVPFKRLEVFNNFHNANILADKAQICGLNSQQIGVPFLWDGINCIIGYIDVIKFFREKIGGKP